jgi:hypothetical protein
MQMVLLIDVVRYKTCIGRSIEKTGVILENYTPMCLAKMHRFLLTSQSLTVTVAFRPTCLSRDIRTQRLVASTYAVAVV